MEPENVSRGRVILPREKQERQSFQRPQRLKAPLSGSGKGLNWCKGAFTPLIERWCARVIEQQGGVVGEPIYSVIFLTIKNPPVNILIIYELKSR